MRFAPTAELSRPGQASNAPAWPVAPTAREGFRCLLGSGWRWSYSSANDFGDQGDGGIGVPCDYPGCDLFDDVLLVRVVHDISVAAVRRRPPSVCFGNKFHGRRVPASSLDGVIIQEEKSLWRVQPRDLRPQETRGVFPTTQGSTHS